MDKYNETLNMIVHQFREKDEKDRKSRGLSKTRSDIESIEYRNNFDAFYTSATNDLINSIKSDFGKLPDSLLASDFIDMDMTRYHDFLDVHLVLPHALAKLLDYQTNLRGNNADIAKICNLFALTAVTVAAKASSIDMTKIKFVRAYQALLKGLENLNIHKAPFSNIGLITSQFLYWFIYDGNSNEPNLNILVDLAEATKGSFGDFKSSIVAYWLIRINPNTSVKFFNSSILPNIK